MSYIKKVLEGELTRIDNELEKLKEIDLRLASQMVENQKKIAVIKELKEEVENELKKYD